MDLRDINPFKEFQIHDLKKKQIHASLRVANPEVERVDPSELFGATENPGGCRYA